MALRHCPNAITTVPILAPPELVESHGTMRSIPFAFSLRRSAITSPLDVSSFASLLLKKIALDFFLDARLRALV
jgi:hypothetical protein